MHEIKKTVIFPQKSDYPGEMFRYDIPIEYHAGCARAYFRKNFIARRFFIKRLEEAVNLLPNGKFERILDIGTGAGVFLPTLSGLSENVYTTDLSPIIIFVKSMLAKRRINNVYLCLGDLINLPYSSDSFDLIVCLSVIDHIKELKAPYEEMNRVLQKDGVLILGYPIENQIFEFLNGLLKTDSTIRRWIAGEKWPSGRTWRDPFLSTFDEIEREAQNLFRIEQLVNIRFLSFDLYRILRLVKKQI